MKCLQAIVMILGGQSTLSAQQGPSHKKPQLHKSSGSTPTSKSKLQSVSPLYRRLVFVLAQDLEKLVNDSVTPIDEKDPLISPYSLHREAVDERIERMEAFDVRTSGDMVLDGMIEVAMSFIEHQKAMQSMNYSNVNFSRVDDCLSDIKEAARGGYTQDADPQDRCAYRDTIKAEMYAERVGAQKVAEEESEKRRQHIKAMQAEADKIQRCLNTKDLDEYLTCKDANK